MLFRMRFTAGLMMIALSGVVSFAFSAPKAPPGKSAELEKAVAALKREFAAAAKSPDAEKLRAACDYFTGEHGVAVDAALAALEKPVPGVPASDVRQTA